MFLMASAYAVITVFRPCSLGKLSCVPGSRAPGCAPSAEVTLNGMATRRTMRWLFGHYGRFFFRTRADRVSTFLLPFAQSQQARQTVSQNRVRYPMGSSFTSDCSPHRLTTTQLSLVTGRRASARGGLSPPCSRALISALCHGHS
jgi:hypothetical protein